MAELGTMRMQLARFPFIMPRTPSVAIMWRSPCHTPVYTFVFPWTCIRIFSRSSGATAVRDLRHGRGDHHCLAKVGSGSSYLHSSNVQIVKLYKTPLI